jgi:uncharacterized protein
MMLVCARPKRACKDHMRYDLSRFKSGTDHIDRTYEPAAFGAESEDFRITSPVHLTGDLTKSGAKFLLKGRLTTTLELACSRCVEAFEVPIDATLDLTFVPAAEPVKPAPTPAPGATTAPREGSEFGRHKKAPRQGHEDVELDGTEVAADELGLTEYSGDAIDLGQMMREQFYLALPMKPLCMPDCKGLCPVCGKNRNRETCSCESTWVDPRFEVLRNLKKGN